MKNCRYLGHTDLRKGIRIWSIFDAESDFDVRLAVAPPKPAQIDQKTYFSIEQLRRKIKFGVEK